MPPKLAFSFLCENPLQRTGLTTLFHGYIAEALRQFPDVHWLLFLGPNQPWSIVDARVELVRDFPANDCVFRRLWADHFRVGPEAKRRGASALLTIGFGPIRTGGLPLVMHVITLHHRHAGSGWRVRYRRHALARGLREAAIVFSNSKWAADRLGSNSRMQVSPEGLDHAVFTASGVRGGEGLPPEYLLWVSNFYPYKRAELALAAYARLSRETRSRFPLVLVGGDWAGGRERARGFAVAHGIERDTHFLGWVGDAALPALYRGARAYVLSTAEETFGRSVTEAMACGCPCVLQDLAVLREVANDAAVFVDYQDSAAAAAVLERVCADDAFVAQLRADGLRRAQDFSYARLARERVSAILAMVKSTP